MTVALEAKDTTLEEVLKHAAVGDDVKLLRDGRAVATVKAESAISSAPLTPEQRERARAALVRMDERRKRLGLTFDFDEFKADVENGRR